MVVVLDCSGVQDYPANVESSAMLQFIPVAASEQQFMAMRHESWVFACGKARKAHHLFFWSSQGSQQHGNLFRRDCG